MNDAPDAATLTVPVTLLPLCGISFAVRTAGDAVTAVGDEVTVAGGEATVAGGEVTVAGGEVTVVRGEVTAVGDAAAMGDVCATALAAEAELPPQAASTAGTIMVNTNGFCIRHVPATGCPCIRRRKRPNRPLAGSRSLSSVGTVVGLSRPAADRGPALSSAPRARPRGGSTQDGGRLTRRRGSFVSALELAEEVVGAAWPTEMRRTRRCPAVPAQSASRREPRTRLTPSPR